MPGNEANRFCFAGCMIGSHLLFVEGKRGVAQRSGYCFLGMYFIVDAYDLVLAVERAELKKIGGINVFTHFNFQVQLFQKFASQAFTSAFAKFKPAAGKFCYPHSPYEFIAYQYAICFATQNTVHPKVEISHLIFV